MLSNAIQPKVTPSRALFFSDAVAAILFSVVSLASPSMATAADLKDANNAMREKDYARVVTILDAHLAEHPDDHRALALRGQAHVELYTPDKALADLNRAIELQPAKKGKDLVSRGRAYTALRDFDRALADLNQAVDLDVKDAERYYYRGVIHSDKLDHEAAFGDFHHALQLDPKYVQAYIARGYTQFHRGVKSRPVVVKQGENTVQAFQFESVANRDLVDQGLADLARAVELDPDNAYAYQMRAGFYSVLQDWPRLVADLRELVRFSPQDPSTINELAWFLATIDDDALRDGQAAVALAEKACELTKHEDPTKLDTLAAALAEDRKFKRAIEIQESAIAKLGNAPPEFKKAFEERLALYRQKTPLRLANPTSWDMHVPAPEAADRPLSARKRKRQAELSDTEQALLRAINSLRRKRGLKAVTVHPTLVGVCREHARTMVERGEITDQFDGKTLGQKIGDAGVAPGQWGITIGRGASTDDLHTEWKNSPDAAANILNPDVNQLGIGTTLDAEGQIYASATYVEIR